MNTCKNIVNGCDFNSEYCKFPLCDDNLKCMNDNNELSDKSTTIMEYFKINDKIQVLQDEIVDLERESEDVFKEVCKDITGIFNLVGVQRPYISPCDEGLYISIGEDDYHDDPFPVSSELFKLLDDYMGCTGSVNIYNNSLGDNFRPCLTIVYSF